MNINQIKRNKKTLLVALALIGTGIYLGNKYQIIQRSHVRDIRDLMTVLLEKGYIRITEGNIVQIVEKVI